jgi:Protein of unknown function (DUF1488)
VNDSQDPDVPPAPFFHDASGALRFWVLTDAARFIGATITREALHFLFQGKASGEDAVATYLQHRREIDDAVLRRVAAGSIEPVMLREADMPQRRRA